MTHREGLLRLEQRKNAIPGPQRECWSEGSGSENVNAQSNRYDH